MTPRAPFLIGSIAKPIQLDQGYLLDAVAIVLFLAGLLAMALLWNARGRAPQSQLPVGTKLGLSVKGTAITFLR